MTFNIEQDAPLINTNSTRSVNTNPKRRISRGNKKTTHRGTRSKKTKKLEKLKILTINTRGIKNKTKSLENTMKAHGTHIAGITETHLQKGEQINIDGFKWLGKERTERKGGGIGFLVRNDLLNKMEKIEPDLDEQNNITEVLWIKIKTQIPIHIGVVYGRQEADNPEKLDLQFQELTTQINKLQQEGRVILMGDINAKLEIKKGQCHQTESKNGQRLRELMLNTRTTATNLLEIHNGTWTRENRNNPQEKSIIDYMIVSENLTQHITESNADDADVYQIKGRKRTDHNALTATIKITTTMKTNKLKKWKKGDPEQWEKFNNCITEKWNKTEDQDRTYTKLGTLIHETLKETIGEITINTDKKLKTNNEEIKEAKRKRKQHKREFEAACRNKNETEIMKAKETYIESQITTRKLIEAENKKRTIKMINKIIDEGGANSTTFWKIRRRITKGKIEEYETIDEKGDTITHPDKAKNHIAEYFENLYTAREGDANYHGWTKAINERVKEIAKEQNDLEENNEITQEELNKAIKQLKPNKSCGPDNIPNEAIINANTETREIIREVLNKCYTQEITPQEWQRGEILRLYKGKGKKGKCENERGITLASNVGKLYERIINNRMTPDINITEHQGGGQKGKSTTDHLIILNSAIKQAKTKKKNLSIALMDVTKAYDKAWLNAILYTLHSSGIKGKLWRIIRDLNTNLTAGIRTKHGLTRDIQIKDSIRQGGYYQ